MMFKKIKITGRRSQKKQEQSHQFESKGESLTKPKQKWYNLRGEGLEL